MALQFLGLTLISMGMCPAQAAVITNLGDAPQTIEVSPTGAGFTPVTIAAGETWRTPGRLVVRYRNREVHMNEDEEFALWKDGSFGPQRRITNGIGNQSQ